MQGKRKCSDCQKFKPLWCFNKNKAYYDKSGYDNLCKKCKRIRGKQRIPSKRHEKYLKNKQDILDRELYRNYGITREQYNEILKQQDYLCAICGKHQSESHKGLHVDHCHDTKRVRGLLCGSCNLAIGLLKHNITYLSKAIEYLRVHERTYPAG